LAADAPCIHEEWLTFAATGYKGLFETVKTPVRDSDGNLLGVVGIARDITARHEAEEQLRIAAYAFEAQEGIVISDASHMIQRVNKAFCEMTGYSAEEVVGKDTSLLHAGVADSSSHNLMWLHVASDGFWKGELIHLRKGGESFPDWVTVTQIKDQNGQVTHYVWMMLDITERKAAAAEIEHLAFYDPLTLLPNRRLLLDRLRHALSTTNRLHTWSGLYFIDLDNFKLLNDTQGHDVGDSVLIEVAHRLMRCVRAGDTVARFGGDEFVVLTEYLSKDMNTAAEQAKRIVEKMKEALSSPFKLAQITHHGTASIGVSLWSEGAHSVDEIIKEADIAMYDAKSNGRDTISFFIPKMHADIGERAELQRDIRSGISRQEFVLHFQPQVDAHQKVLGAEALVRWNHPTRGLLTPASFIRIAEESDLILPLGEWIMDSACSTLATWAKSHRLRHLDLSVNVSARQFRHPHFVDSVLDSLRAAQAPPTNLILELTESMMVSDLTSTIEKMDALVRAGIRFSLDDFGTGFSSLSCLTRFPLSQLKIDRSFIMRLPGTRADGAIVQTILALGRHLGLVVIAEGVEKRSHREFLEQYGRPVFQGYLFGRPMNEAAFEERVLAAGPTRPAKSERHTRAAPAYGK
jgi:diguanylate cyclase (GGDEF)-like protein/PAS domain S-box-containing protein